MRKELNFIVESSGVRLDKFLSSKANLPRTYIQKLIKEGKVAVDGQNAKASLKLNAGSKIFLLLPPLTNLIPEDVSLTIIYEDDDVLVIDKPAGLSVHPAPGHESGTLVNALLSHYPDLADVGDALRPGIVHRLDKDASGLMMVAKNEIAQQNLSEQFKEHLVVKKYLALIEGHLTSKQGLIEAPIGCHPRHRKKMAVVSGGKESRTRFQVLDFIGDYTFVEVVTETGRTHQIRVHFSAIGHPVFGDSVYGKKSPLLSRLFLHACYLGFSLPKNGDFVNFHSELPSELRKLIQELKKGKELE
jgi:23S rRNA pseudouridine1911/1915/1917 synthase